MLEYLLELGIREGSGREEGIVEQLVLHSGETVCVLYHLQGFPLVLRWRGRGRKMIQA